MGAVRFLHEIGAGRHSKCHKRLFVGIVLRLITNQDAVLGRSRIYVISATQSWLGALALGAIAKRLGAMG